MKPEQVYELEVESFLHRMRMVKATKEEFYAALLAARNELDVEILACEETL